MTPLPRLLSGPLAALAAATCALAACGTFDPADTSMQNAPTADAGGGGDGPSDALPDVPVPPGCDAAADPKDAPKCVVSEFGVFADATAGSDTNPGTKDAPVKTLAAALSKLAGKARVYVCEGTYPEHLALSTPVSLYAGFACASWSYTGVKAKVAPADAGYALEVKGASGPVVLADLAFVAAPGTSASPSSIAAWVSDANAVTFRRCDLTAAQGFDGASGDDGAPGTPDKPLDGVSANMTTPGALKTCTCSTGGTSSGGGGGAVLSDGQNGGPNIPENPSVRCRRRTERQARATCLALRRGVVTTAPMRRRRRTPPPSPPSASSRQPAGPPPPAPTAPPPRPDRAVEAVADAVELAVAVPAVDAAARAERPEPQEVPASPSSPSTHPSPSSPPRSQRPKPATAVRVERVEQEAEAEAEAEPSAALPTAAAVATAEREAQEAQEPEAQEASR
jgi:hypothetical protein